MPEAKMYIQSLGDLKNLFFLDYGLVDYPDSLFLNTTHLNLLGAKRFSAEIKEQLIKIDPVFK